MNNINTMARLSAIFFDLDGTLVTSHLDFTKIREEINYAGDVDILKHLAQLPSHEAERIQRILVKHEADDANKAQALEGAAELLTFCQQQDWPTVVVTRNSRAMAELKLNKAGQPCGPKRMLDTAGALGLVLYWYRTRCSLA